MKKHEKTIKMAFCDVGYLHKGGPKPYSFRSGSIVVFRRRFNYFCNGLSLYTCNNTVIKICTKNGRLEDKIFLLLLIYLCLSIS